MVVSRRGLHVLRISSMFSYHLGSPSIYACVGSSIPTIFLLRCWSLRNSSICASFSGRFGGPSTFFSGDGSRS